MRGQHRLRGCGGSDCRFCSLLMPIMQGQRAGHGVVREPVPFGVGLVGYLTGDLVGQLVIDSRTQRLSSQFLIIEAQGLEGLTSIAMVVVFLASTVIASKDHPG